MLEDAKYFEYAHKLRGRFAEIDDYQYVQLPYVEYRGGKKVLYILDYLPQEDLKSGKLLSGATGALLEAIDNAAQRLFLRKRVKSSWAAITYNAFRTAGRPDDFRSEAHEVFTQRIHAFINKYKPDLIIGFGADVMRALIPHKVALDPTKLSYWLGVPIESTFKTSKREHTCTVTCTLSLDHMLGSFAGAQALLGYVTRNVANGMLGRLAYSLDAERLKASKPVLIDTIAKFDKLLAMLKKQKLVAVDTEGINLAKVTNKLLTVQFAKCQDFGYIVPMYHKDTPFNPKELRYIKQELCKFFEGDNENDYHIYCNAKFDLTFMRHQLGISHFANDVWDVQGGQFALDENMKVLSTVIGSGHYGLGVLCVQYGFDGYLTAEFGKNQRATIKDMDLHDKSVQQYMGWDVTTIIGINELQRRLARDEKYAKYEKVVRYQLSDTTHGYSCMEFAGVPMDIDYLYKLRLPTSPIEMEITRLENEFLQTDAVKKANAIIAGERGVPQNGLLRKGPPMLFDLSKNAHKQLLFFNVLGLEPLDTGASGDGKLDKAFQKKNAGVKEVALYTGIGQAKKLRNAYVKSFIQKLAEDTDFQSDHKMRPNYSYIKVVTFRTSASDPNLQQIPAHSALAKYIKRLFVAPEGYLWVKVDYRVHEVRCWGLIAFDKGVASVFQAAKNLRDEFRSHPSEELGKRLSTEADIHVMNASYFFKMEPAAVDKPTRNRVKGVIFGLIYQMALKTLAGNIGLDLEETEKLYDNFVKRFPKAMAWIEDVKKFAAKNYYVESPLGCRRHLWDFMLSRDMGDDARRCISRATRQSVNSPVQGMGAQFMSIGNRNVDKKCFEIRKTRPSFSLYSANSVHDSLETLVKYEDLLLGLDVIEASLTTEVRKVVKERFGFDFVVDLEIDFELGPTLANVEGWDFSAEELNNHVMRSLLFQRNEMGHNIDVQEKYDACFSNLRDASPWLRRQIKNVGIKFDLTEKKYIGALVEQHEALEKKLADVSAALPSLEKALAKAEQRKKESAIAEAKANLEGAQKKVKDTQKALSEIGSYVASLTAGAKRLKDARKLLR